MNICFFFKKFQHKNFVRSSSRSLFLHFRSIATRKFGKFFPLGLDVKPSFSAWWVSLSIINTILYIFRFLTNKKFLSKKLARTYSNSSAASSTSWLMEVMKSEVSWPSEDLTHSLMNVAFNTTEILLEAQGFPFVNICRKSVDPAFILKLLQRRKLKSLPKNRSPETQL